MSGLTPRRDSGATKNESAVAGAAADEQRQRHERDYIERAAGAAVTLAERGKVESVLSPPDEPTAGTMADARHDAVTPLSASAAADPGDKEEYSPEFQDEYRRLWHRESELRRCNAPMPGGVDRQLCDLWPNHVGPHVNAATSSEWGKDAGRINAR